MIDVEKYFKKSDLLPAIVQEDGTGEVLMLAYMNRQGQPYVSIHSRFFQIRMQFQVRHRQPAWLLKNRLLKGVPVLNL
jgi:phosphoribosyl-AMP cyclohydrolase